MQSIFLFLKSINNSFFIIGVLITCFCGKIEATTQIPDRLIYKGKTYYLHNNPLEAYFKKYPKKRPKADVSSTALWRGYIATFEIIDQMLYLKDIEVQVWMHEEGKEEWQPDVSLKSVVKKIFPDQKKIPIDWCSEILVLPSGKLKKYEHMGYNSSYEHYTLLEIKEGALLKIKELETDEFAAFKKNQLYLFKKTDRYQTLAKKWKDKYEYTEEELDQLLERSILKYTHRFLEE
ncbi:hypothetical protein [Aureispira anguillae]|uniref:Uncharacterized protein n=1 Tax=Aureispira anguillae TaxID=2864201 RepID=A0A916DRY6_9BACT|nr:hypothetical protein [Aureispira anguillae]BDS12159.1 hypothetical protein AsAng_0028740 [Aureispira anguillae]